MKKNDFIIVGILVALMFVWMNFYPAIEQKYFPRPAQPAPQVAPVAAEKPAVSVTAEKSAVIAEAVSAKVPEAVLPSAPEQTMTLSNDDIELTVSSYGGAVVSAVLSNYPAENRKGSGPVILDFTNAPALRYAGLPVPAGVLEKTADGLRYVAALGDGRFLERTLKLEGEYLLKVEDSFVNSGKTPWVLPELRLPTGPMSEAKGTTAMVGVITLGVDTFAPADGVHHWGKEFNKLFSDATKTGMRTATPEQIAPRSVDWVAAKNKFFVQILTPERAASAFDLSVRRAGEGKKNVPAEVSAAIKFNSEQVAANETLTRKASFYIGPKDYSFLKTQGMEQVEVMEFKSMGFWKFMNPIMYPIKTGLLWGLKALHVVVHNYGVAILLLTVIVRMIFWPITHKGTESMRKMQALQPQLKEIREKFKDNPQRMQQETMAFYKENKVNPLGGCLPMLIQIPVFIALFVVLRSAVELRFSKFLWISDLSEPENLFAGMIPVVGSLNILPLLMTVTTIWQQKMTPSAGDPQQQKIMAIMMPLMMLFFFYTMPSGLVLYWTTSNLIMIVQMMIKKQPPVAVAK
ncbi:MAG: membrane protein insertase YidC [Kiritimatiellaceae bacterium]|nr:membrane protein insertase YidC [Kiritimatiellaceae bacterium]